MKLDVAGIINKIKPSAPNTDNAFELVKYEKLKQNRIKTVYYVILFFIVGLTILINVINYNSQKNAPIPTINEENIEVTQMDIVEGPYEVSTEPAKTINGQEYTKVKISDYETTWPKAKADAVIGSNNQLTTKIYVLSFENKERFFLNLFSPKEIQIIRLSVAGEHEFTPEEVDAYKTLAAYYFTYQKAKKLGRADKENYNINIEGQAGINGILDGVKDRFRTEPTQEETDAKKTEIRQQMEDAHGSIQQGVNLDDFVITNY